MRRRGFRLFAFGVMTSVLMFLAVASAQRRPDFSGTWQIDLDRSKGASPANARVDIIVIKQDTKTMTIEQKGVPTVVYHLDGTPVKNIRLGRGGEATFTSAWDGDKLVTTVKDGQEGQTETRYMEGDSMVDLSELKSALGIKFSRKLYWTRVK
jgi:hypothetical protein